MSYFKGNQISLEIFCFQYISQRPWKISVISEYYCHYILNHSSDLSTLHQTNSLIELCLALSFHNSRSKWFKVIIRPLFYFYFSSKKSCVCLRFSGNWKISSNFLFCKSFCPDRAVPICLIDQISIERPKREGHVWSFLFYFSYLG